MDVPAAIVKNGQIIYASSGCTAFLGEGCCGRAISSVLTFSGSLPESSSFSALTLDGFRTRVKCDTIGEYKLLSFDSSSIPDPEPDQKVTLASLLSISELLGAEISRSAARIGLATECLEPPDGDSMPEYRLIKRSCRRLVKTASMLCAISSEEKALPVDCSPIPLRRTLIDFCEATNEAVAPFGVSLTFSEAVDPGITAFIPSSFLEEMLWYVVSLALSLCHKEENGFGLEIHFECKNGVVPAITAGFKIPGELKEPTAMFKLNQAAANAFAAHVGGTMALMSRADNTYLVRISLPPIPAHLADMPLGIADPYTPTPEEALIFLSDVLS